MRTRKDLHVKLCGILGSKNVYYRKPSIGMKYPCFLYDLEGSLPFFADNIPYINPKRWSLTVIDEDADSELPNKIEEQLPYCRFDRSYESNGLNHFVFTFYY